MKPTYKELQKQLTESRREFTAANATIHNLELQLADAKAQGVDEAIEQLIKKFEGTGHIGVPVMVLESFAAQLRQGAEHE